MAARKTFTIRQARMEDDGEISRLCPQLGYHASQQDIHQRLTMLLPNHQNLILVAETSTHTLAGWMHAIIVQVLESPAFVEIGGVVVDDAFRRQGIGRRLIAGAEEWALLNGLYSVRLRSNIIRPEAHDFYPSIGYTHTKTQKTYEKYLKEE